MNYPFLNKAFFSALETSQSTSAETGWQAVHQVIKEGEKEVAFMPLYAKSHSYGEYVFDWAWANAYHRNGREYYPKLLTAIPFTPATGPRARFADDSNSVELSQQLIDQTLDIAEQIKASSWHFLFPNKAHLKLFNDPRFLLRDGVQYHWFNKDYQNFDDFLSKLTSRKRKMIIRERRKVVDQGFVIEALQGEEIGSELWQQFSLFYQNTYLKRSGTQGYLTPEFFEILGKSMPEHCLMITARLDNELYAAAFYLHDETTLFGRYWGCRQEFDFLHFELCYYQGIDFAIAHKLQKFDAGAQGEHKIVRGFEPVRTYSLHWIAEPAFREAIANFLHQEKAYTLEHLNRAREMLPYKD